MILTGTCSWTEKNSFKVVSFTRRMPEQQGEGYLTKKGGKQVSAINDKVKEISDKIEEHIVAVKGTLELADASLPDDELHGFMLKAMERMDDMQKLYNELAGHSESSH